MTRERTLKLLVALALASLVSLPAIPASAATGTISGRVTLDGVGLAGVEVFLWDAGAELRRYTCTGETGSFRFGNVVAARGVWVATGPSVNLPFCDNRDFQDPDSGKALLAERTDPFRLRSGDTETIRFDIDRAAGPVCAGLEPTIQSDARRITGTNGDDVILGGGRAQRIIGKGGNDFICGRDGDDTILAGRGIDIVFGEEGQDLLEGGGGVDLAFGGEGNDELLGNAGNDLLVGDGGTDSADGGPGNDRCKAETEVSC